MPYRVPDGYFASLEARLSRIPQETGRLGGNIPADLDGRTVRTVSMSGRLHAAWRRVRPYMAAAAAFAVVAAGGFTMLRNSSRADSLEETEMSALEIIRLADLVPVTDPYLLYGEKQEQGADGISPDDITAYLIDTGTTLEHIGYYETGK